MWGEDLFSDQAIKHYLPNFHSITISYYKQVTTTLNTTEPFASGLGIPENYWFLCDVFDLIFYRRRLGTIKPRLLSRHVVFRYCVVLCIVQTVYYIIRSQQWQ